MIEDGAHGNGVPLLSVDSFCQLSGRTASPRIVVLALVVWVGYRQTTWRAVDASRMWKMPIALAVIGLVNLGDMNLGDFNPADLSRLNASTRGVSFSGVDLALLLTELVLSLGLGAIMGAISTFRPMTQEGCSPCPASFS